MATQALKCQRHGELTRLTQAVAPSEGRSEGRVWGAGTGPAEGVSAAIDRGRDAIVESAIRRGRATPARTTGAPALAVGDDVVHAKWGEGVVLEVIGQGDNAEAVIRFPGVGEKRLLLAWASLKRAY